MNALLLCAALCGQFGASQLPLFTNPDTTIDVVPMAMGLRFFSLEYRDPSHVMVSPSNPRVEWECRWVSADFVIPATNQMSHFFMKQTVVQEWNGGAVTTRAIMTSLMNDSDLQGGLTCWPMACTGLWTFVPNRAYQPGLAASAVVAVSINP